ncbi:MAG: disulfide bond formation protein B [Rickettsiaceae bacterium H1]|nr:disulfide bond formation protein B [Rickettsiaceae bacterium H1]
MNLILNKKIVPIYFLLASLSALITAYVMEHGFDIRPCKLCYYQRVAYFSSVLLALFAIIKPKKFIIIAMIISFLLNGFIAGYQFAVEQHWTESIVSCVSKNIMNDLTDKEILDFTISSHEVRCDIPQFVFLGVSLSGWNMIYCGIILAVFVFIIKKRNEITVS